MALSRAGSRASKASARSATVRAIGPHCERTASWPTSTVPTPRIGQRSRVGLKPQMPENAAGDRMLPPMSVPNPRGLMPAATAVASPPDEPPAVWSREKALAVCPKSGLRLSAKSIVCERLVRPRMTAPASRSAVTSAASRRARAVVRLLSPRVVGRPSRSKHSFNVTGSPCSGPRTLPSARSRVARVRPRRGPPSRTPT
jgi:hypothetical protein